jgi:hypothetical protein
VDGVIIHSYRLMQIKSLLRERPNKPIQPTPLRGPEIVAFLKTGFGPTAFSIYQGGAADGQDVRPPPSIATPKEQAFGLCSRY